METRVIPSTGEAVPVIGCGTWKAFDVASGTSAVPPLRDVLETMLNAGGTVIDSSPMYGRAERIVGECLSTGLLSRAFLATKVWTRGRQEGIEQMQRSIALMRIGSDRPFDLIQIHNLLDWRTHLATLREWKEQGFIRYLGITHYTASAHGDLEAVLRSEPVDFV